MGLSNAERQRRHRWHRRGDHSLCDPAFCARPTTVPAGGQSGRRVVEGPQALYRFYGEADELLYVGITVDLPQRLKQHRTEKAWWTDVRRITVEHHPDRDSVEQAERDAIAAQRPRWNVTHNDGTPPIAVRPATTRLTISYGGAEVRMESPGPPDIAARLAACLAAELKGALGG